MATVIYRDQLTTAERKEIEKRHAPYHRFEEFWTGFSDYQHAQLAVSSGLLVRDITYVGISAARQNRPAVETGTRASENPRRGCVGGDRGISCKFARGSAPDQPPQNPICEKTTLTKKYQQAKATANDIQPITPAYNSFIHDCSDVGMTPS
jgi:hypothetical protein